MSDSQSTSNPPEITINIKGESTHLQVDYRCGINMSPGPSELKLQIAIAIDKTVLDLKKAIAEKSDVEADKQRLIYSGMVPRYHQLCLCSFDIHYGDVTCTTGRVLKVHAPATTL